MGRVSPIFENGQITVKDVIAESADKKGSTINKPTIKGRSITFKGTKFVAPITLNRNSVINYLNAHLPQGGQIQRSWFFGYFDGSHDDRQLQELFINLVKNESATGTDSSFPQAVRDLFYNFDNLPTCKVEESEYCNCGSRLTHPITKVLGKDPVIAIRVVSTQAPDEIKVVYFCKGGDSWGQHPNYNPEEAGPTFAMNFLQNDDEVGIYGEIYNDLLKKIHELQDLEFVNVAGQLWQLWQK